MLKCIDKNCIENKIDKFIIYWIHINFIENKRQTLTIYF